MMKQNVRLRLAELERHLLTMFTDLVPESQYVDDDEENKRLLEAWTEIKKTCCIF